MSGSRIDIMIPTFNEGRHIEAVVANARTVGDVYVLDSGSTDGTPEMARRAGATVVEHPWEGYARQKNWGLDHLPLRGDWVFILDADERITPALREELHRVAASDTPHVGFFVNRLMLFLGQPVRHGGLYPSWNLRFFRRGKARYEDRAVHEHMVCDGTTGYLREQMLHIRIETISEYLAKHVRYADLESDEWVRMRLGTSQTAQPEALFKDVLRVRQWAKRRLWPRLPMRPTLRFLYMYFIRFGILDGRVGWRLAVLMAHYEYMITLLYREKLHAVQVQRREAVERAATVPHPAGRGADATAS